MFTVHTHNPSSSLACQTIVSFVCNGAMSGEAASSECPEDTRVWQEPQTRRNVMTSMWVVSHMQMTPQRNQNKDNVHGQFHCKFTHKVCALQEVMTFVQCLACCPTKENLWRPHKLSMANSSNLQWMALRFFSS